MPIFAALVVPEVWRWKDGVLQVLHLEGEQFVERPESRVLPGFPFDEARRLIALRSTMSETDLIRAFREHVRGSARGADVSER